MQRARRLRQHQPTSLTSLCCGFFASLCQSKSPDPPHVQVLSEWDHFALLRLPDLLGNNWKKKKFKFNEFLTRIERKLGDKSTLIWALMSAEWQIHRLFQTCYQTLGPISLIHSVVDLFMIGLKLISKTVYKLKFVFLGLNLAYFNLDEEASSIFVFCNFNLIFFWSTVYEGKKAKNKRWDKWGSFQ